MKMFKFASALTALVLTAGLASAANATTYYLNIDGTSGIGGPGADGDWGQVDVTAAANGGLNFVVTLDPGVTFHSNGNHTSFAFSLNGDTGTTVNVTGLSAGFVILNSGLTSGAMTQGSFPDPSIGSFEYGLDCPNCRAGGPFQSTLSFTVTAANNSVLSLNPVNGTSGGAANIRIAETGLTGAVGFSGGAVPEPATWAMMILGMGMVGAGLRIRRRSGLTLA